MPARKKIDIERLVRKINKDLKEEGLNQEGVLEIPDKGGVDPLRKRIEFSLLTAREYSNPEELLPLNPVLRLIKRSILAVLRVYTRSQIVFNKRVLSSIEDLYRYMRRLEQKIDSRERK